MEPSTIYLIIMSNLGMIGAALSFTLIFSVMDEIYRNRLMKNKEAFLTDVKIMVIASIFGIAYFILTLLGFKVGEVLGVISALLFLVTAARIVLRSRGVRI